MSTLPWSPRALIRSGADDSGRGKLSHLFDELSGVEGMGGCPREHSQHCVRDTVPRCCGLAPSQRPCNAARRQNAKKKHVTEDGTAELEHAYLIMAKRAWAWVEV